MWECGCVGSRFFFTDLFIGFICVGNRRYVLVLRFRCWKIFFVGKFVFNDLLFVNGIFILGFLLVRGY